MERFFCRGKGCLIFIVNPFVFVPFVMRYHLFLIALIITGCQSSPDSSREYPSYIKGASLESRGMEERVIVFFGSDITAGYGLDTEEAFPDLIRKRIDSSYLPFAVVNAGVKSDSSRSGLNRVSYLLTENVDVFVLSLGFSDAREMRSPLQIRANLKYLGLFRPLGGVC